MKKKIVVFFTVFISMFIKIQLITADVDFTEYGKIGSTGSYVSKEGNHNGFQGFRITVCETTPKFECNHHIDIHNGGYNYIDDNRCKNIDLYSSAGYSKLEYYKKEKEYSYVNLSTKSHKCATKKYSLLANPKEPLPSCLKYYLSEGCDISKVFTYTENEKLYATDFFKNVLKKSGYTCLSDGKGCNDGQIITVEPMFSLKVSDVEYFGTGFEMATVFNMASNGLKFHSGTFNATYSMYLTQAYDVLSAGDTSNIGKKSTNVAYSNFAGYLTGKTGNGINIYKVSDIDHPKPQKGYLKIIKTDEAGGNLEGAEFGIFKGFGCEGNSPKYNVGKFNLEAGNYSVKEITAPPGYELSNSCQNVTVTAGETTPVTFKNYHKKISLTIKKHGNNNENLNAEFSIYKFGCKKILNSNFERTINVPNNGSVTVELDTEGYYCIVETRFLKGYSVANNEISAYCWDDNGNGVCDEGEYRKSTSHSLKYGDSYTLEFYNEKTCVSEFNSLADKNSMASRIELYNKYKDKNGFNLNQLLNLNITDAGSACKFKEPKYSGKISCFDFSYPYVDFDANFNERNVSNFNERYIDNEKGQIDFCLTNISIKSDTVLNNRVVTAGQRIFDGKINLNMIKKCYNYKVKNSIEPISKLYTLPTVSIYEDKYNYIVKPDNSYIVNPDTSPAFQNIKPIGINCSGVPCGYQYERKYTYQYIPLNSSFGFGNIFDISPSDTSKYIKTMNGVTRYYYRNIGNTSGFFSKFMDSGEKSLIFNVNLNLNGNGDIFRSNDESCKYRVKQELVSETLNLQFEQVNLKNPFIEKNNNPITDNVTIRKVGSNWRSIDINSFDLNGDGVRNEIDEAIKKYAIDVIKNPEASASENGDNYLVKYVMNGRPNSYSKDKPKYVITLTPSDIKAIRNYNDSNDYQDYEKVYCTDSNNVLCSTDFIDNLKTTDPKVCVGDTCEKLSSGINFKREVTGGSDVKDASYIKFSLSNSDYGKIEGDMNIVVKKGDKIEFPELNIKEGYGLLGWITKNENNRFNYNNYIDISNVTATLGTQEYMAVLAKEHKIYRETDGNNSYVCTVLSRKSMQESGCPRLADPSNASGFEGWKYNNRVIDNYYTRKFITDNDDFIITFTPSYTQIKIYESIEVVMNNTKIRYSKRGVDIVSKIDKIIGTYSMNGKIFSEPINKNQCEYDGDVHSTRLGKNAFRARCKRIYSKYIDYEIVKIPLDYIETNKNALGAGIFTIYTNSNYENEISEAYIKDSENNTHKFERTHLGLRIDLKKFVPGKYPVGDYWFDLVFKGKNEDLITCKFKVTKTKLGLIPKRDVIICPEYQ